ncbi:DUF3159 domain-containing protein [Agrococcus casei]|uniref:PROBABLE CONSERVED INTEGRAL MEMBRANE ALANINE AND LEUCINE RICH PROTEIN n=1 Tax=Agrococcus casei LMG 22410 TaxID=1255656 RepID=A0A1R4FP62_9MICO|nr:DUF3159 domain-containing protein [Agrococcus casei]SJM57705.1 PROBABLE CONSERVED INTEGRAL MEMBRANE ALANINE AND LEUCINE RICH PROTEIN [Agrococcus casei LMG 22410]
MTDTPEEQERSPLAEALQQSKLGQLSPDQKPTGQAVLSAMGGVRGLVESLTPGFLFLLLYTITRDVWISVLVPLGLSLLFVAIRVITKGQSMLAFAGLIGVGLSAATALLTGRAENNFLWGFIVNGVLIVVILITLAVRRPLVSLIAGALTEKPHAWRTEAAKRRVGFWATVLLLATFAARLAVQVPLYLMGESGVQALAATKLLMGTPLYAGVLWVVWLMVRSVSVDPGAKSKVS